ncbi:hypothetical protein BGZ70_006022 [Mortierella alpina]|uniref:Uncharacterized protein n=1 Tax=Mortierella alpina TaxID=64518 RepID=A0A9P6J8P8_MORAP|nr:hypothetical protein BGZ70_006022 [Mortierella alpina]
MTLLPSEPLAPAATNVELNGTVAVTSQKRAPGPHANGTVSRGKENDESLVNGAESKARTSSLPVSAPVEETIDIENVDVPASQDDDEAVEEGRSVRKRKATVPFDEDTEMDTDELLEKEVKTKKKPSPKSKAGGAGKEVATSVTIPKKTTKKPSQSAFSDDEDSRGASQEGTILSKFKRVQKSKVPYVKPENPLDFNPSYVYSLARQYPDNYWKHHAESKSGMINKITRVWSLEDYSLLTTLRDAKEEHIDEFYVGAFVPDQTKILIGGKLKDRNNWSEADEDNNILPCPLKLFDILSGEVVARLDGHAEELLCVKKVHFKGENYFLSGSQDGYLNKWHMDSDWKTLNSMVQMEDGITCMAFTVSFVPNTGNKYFLAAADENLRLYDFENAALLQTFENMYSSYCDCGKFIQPVDFPMPPPVPEESQTETTDELTESSIKKGKMKAEAPVPVAKPQQFAYFISRGVELLDSEERMIAKDYNSCTLHKLIYPDTKGGKWYLSEVKRFQDEEYFSNAWLIKISSNGRYLMAPTCTGEVFIYNLKTGQVTGVLKDHEDVEVRDVIFHPTRPLLFTSADDGQVKVYTYKNEEDRSKALRDSAETERKTSEAVALMSVATDLSAVSVKDDDENAEEIVEIDEDLTE